MTYKQYINLLKEFNLVIRYDVGYFKNYPVCGYRLYKSTFNGHCPDYKNNSLIMFERYSKSKTGITGEYIGKSSTTVKTARKLITKQIENIKLIINTNKINSIAEDFS